MSLRTALQSIRRRFLPLPTSSTVDRRVWPIAGSSLLMGTSIGVVIPLMPLFTQELSISTLQLGLITSTMGFARLLSNVPAAYFSDTIGRKPLLVGGPIATSASMVGTGISQSLYELMGWRFLSGAGGSMQMTAAQLYLADISTTSNRARTMAPTQAAFQIGFAMGPGIAGMLAQSFGLRVPFFCVGAMILAVALNNYLMLPETLKKGIRPDKTSFRQVMSQWRDLIHDTDIRRLLTLHGMYWATASGSQMTLLPLMISSSFHLGAAEIGGIFTLFALVNVLCSQPVAWIADTHGRKSVILPGSILVVGCLIAVPMAQSYEQLIPLCVLWAMGNTGLGTAPVAYLSDKTSSNTRSQALGLLRSSGDIGLLLGAASLAAVAEYSSIGTAMWINAGLFSIASLNFALRAKS